MRKAVIDQMLLWIVLFIGFVTIFFMVIDYYLVVKVKDRCDAIVHYGVRMKALGKDDIDIVTGLNNIKGNYFDTIVEGDIDCTEDSGATNYQVVFTTSINITNRFISENESIYSKASSFNEVDSSSIDCNLTLRAQ